MKKILLITTIYRVGERIYPIIPELSKEFEVDVLKTAQMGNGRPIWYGDNDMRIVFDNKYGEYINKIYYDFKDVTPAEYDLVLMDDDRYKYDMNKYYNTFNVPVIGHQHGNQHMSKIKYNLRVGHRTSWDYVTVFGKVEKDRYVEEKGEKFGERILVCGIPSNDELVKYKPKAKYILVIVNFLGNRGPGTKNRNVPRPFRPFNEKLFEDIGLLELQQKYHKKVIIKIKSRADHGKPNDDFEYLKKNLPKGLDYEVLMDVEDDNELIAHSFIVISAPSVMAFKPIQLGIPTIILEGYGQAGVFANYKGYIRTTYLSSGDPINVDMLPKPKTTYKLETQSVFDEIERQLKDGKDIDFIKDNLEGGLEFNAIKKYIDEVKKLI